MERTLDSKSLLVPELRGHHFLSTESVKDVDRESYKNTPHLSASTKAFDFRTPTPKLVLANEMQT